MGAIGILTIIATTIGGCDSTAVSPGSGGQSGNGAAGRGGNGAAGAQVGTGSGGLGGVGAAGAGGGAAGAGVAGTGGGVAGANGGGGGGGPPTIWTSDATTAFVADTGGGFVGPPPTGSGCGYGVGSYTFTPADNKLVWHYCDSSQATAGTPFQFIDGSRTVNADERTTLVRALEAVVLSTNITCGADKSTRLLVVTRPGGAVTYLDSFYSCQRQGIYVDGIDAVFNAARQLAK